MVLSVSKSVRGLISPLTWLPCGICFVILSYWFCVPTAAWDPVQKGGLGVFFVSLYVEISARKVRIWGQMAFFLL